jgi:hypothetical protein
MDPLLASSGGICTFPHHSRTFTIDELSNTYDTALPLPSPRFRPSCVSPIQRIYTNCSPVLRIALLAAPVRSGHPRHLIPPPPFWPCAAAFGKHAFQPPPFAPKALALSLFVRRGPVWRQSFHSFTCQTLPLRQQAASGNTKTVIESSFVLSSSTHPAQSRSTVAPARGLDTRSLLKSLRVFVITIEPRISLRPQIYSPAGQDRNISSPA